jgi:sarcosine oxidase subunit gamma
VAERYQRQSALAHLAIEGRAQPDRGAAGIAMGERPLPGIVNLRGGHEAVSTAFEAAFGFALPAKPNSAAGKGKAGAKTTVTALWLGPDEWWLLGADGAGLGAKLTKALDGQAAAVTEVGESRACIRVAGPHARDLLAKGCPLDLHPRVFRTGQCAQSTLAKAGVLIHQVDDEPAYDIYVLRSFAEYLWLWLEDAAREYGMAVVAG